LSPINCETAERSSWHEKRRLAQLNATVFKA
jgi:hypothetical protein